MISARPRRWGLAAIFALCATLMTLPVGAQTTEQGLAAFDAVWRTIDATYYDPAFGGLDWKTVRDELRPRAARAGSIDEQRDVIRAMLARLGQSHFVLLTTAAEADTPLGPASVPVDVRVTPSGVLVTRVHEADDALRPGDRVLQVDGEDVDAQLRGAAGTRRADEAWRRVTRLLSGAAGTTVTLTVASPDGRTRTVPIRRRIGPGEDVRVGNLPPLRAHLQSESRRTPAGRQVGVIRFNVWMATLADPFADAIDRFRQADGLVIDLRGNPGGLAEMIRGIAGHLVDEPVVLGRMHMRDLELVFRANPRRSTRDGRSVVPYAGPVAILVDELTASASECFAGGLQAIGRARLFGTRTAGQALPAATEQLATGDVLMYAIGDFVRPDGRRLEGVGVVPDEVVAVDADALRAGRDAEHAALVWIDQGAARSGVR